MKAVSLHSLLVSCFVLFFAGFVYACPTPGTYSIGPTGNYSSLTQAIADLNSCPLTGAYILELQPSYSAAVETYPISIPDFVGASNSNTITVRPQSAAVNLSISTNNTGGTIIFNGTKYFSFDGRAGGTGTTKNLTIQNTSVNAGSIALKFINSASDNTIKYCSVRSSNNSATNGTIVFSTAGAGQGNDNNRIEFNNIFEASGGLPINAIFQSGSVAPNDNSSNLISNNNIYNFYNATNATSGILLQDHASDWIIDNNHFYQTVSRSLTANLFSAIRSTAHSVKGLTISNNFIGGTTANAGGSNLILTGSGIMQMISILTDTTSFSNIQGNTIRNINFTSSSGNTFGLIVINGGRVKVGTVATPNNLGNTGSNGSIKVSVSNASAFPNNPIFGAVIANNNNVDSCQIVGNQIGGIDFSGSSTTAYNAGIYIAGNQGIHIISENLIGSTTLSNNITSTLNAYLLGIAVNINNALQTQTIRDNRLANFSTTSVGVNNIIYGIITQNAAKYLITGNTLYNFTSASTSTSYSITGIYSFANITDGQTISDNKIYQFTNTNNSIAVGTVGVYFVGPNTANNVISKNLIHSFQLATSSNSGYLNGIHLAGGSATVQHNLIRLGITGAGGAITKGHIFRGIYETAGVIANYFFNSVYIGGTSVAASISATYCFASLATAGTRQIKNNIFYNARSNTGAGGAKHYAIQLTAGTGLSCDYNVLYADGTDGQIGFLGATANTLINWQTIASQDANSKSANPQFIDPTGSTAALNLHINHLIETPVESGGTPIAGFNTDYDNELRASLTPTDIGADAGDFIAYQIDFSIASLAVPNSNYCNPYNGTISILLQNNQARAINLAEVPVNVTLQVTGMLTQTFTGIANSGIIPANGTLLYTLPGTINMASNGNYTFNASFTVSGIAQDINLPNNNMTPTTLTVGSINVWKGINTNWNDGINWCNNTVPDATRDVLIPDLGVAANYPVVSSGNIASTLSLTISNNAQLTIQPNATGNIQGLLSNNGTITNRGLLNLTGTDSYSIPGNGSVVYMNNLEVNKSGGATVSINKKMEVMGTLTPRAGTIAIDDSVTLRSTADSTARIAEVGGSFTYHGNGKFIVQRYIPARRAWRLLTSPLINTQTIYNSWQNAGQYGAGNYNVGTLITGPNANPATNGLDLSTQNQSSLKKWDTATQKLIITTNTLTENTSSALNPLGAKNNGYFIFVRGDRNPANTSLGNSNATTLSNSGFLQTGDQIFKASSASGSPANRRLTLIGNPYASPIDFGLLEKNNLLDQFYVWDPQALDVGRYVTILKSGSNYIAIPDRGAGGPNQYIQSGQAFFVETDLNTAISPTLTIREAHKVDQSQISVFRPATITGGIRIDLWRSPSNGTPILADGTIALSNSAYTNNVTLDEPIKMANINETIGLLRNNQLLAAEKLAFKLGDTIHINLSKLTARAYQLTLQPDIELEENSVLVLEDQFNNKKYALPSNQAFQVAFIPTAANAGSYAPDRFRLLNEQLVSFQYIQINSSQTSNLISWAVNNTIWVDHFEIEKWNETAQRFETISQVNQLLSGNNQFSFTENGLTAGKYTYRIKAIGVNGNIGYSEKVSSTLYVEKCPVSIFPNPVTTNTIRIRCNNLNPGKYRIHILNSAGQLAQFFEFTRVDNAGSFINIPHHLTRGNYSLQILKIGQPTPISLNLLIQ